MVKMKGTIFKYIFVTQLKAMCFVSVSIFFLIYLFDFVEVIRKFSASSFTEILFAMKLTFLKTPQTFHEVLNYIYFVTATFTLWYLCHSHQITVMKSAGSSPQQILFPFLTFAFGMALFWLLIVQPFGLWTAKHYENLLAHNAPQQTNQNIWIDYPYKNLLIYINEIDNDKISGFCLFNTNNGERIFSKSAYIKNNSVQLEDIITITADGNSKNFKKTETIQDNFIFAKLINLLSIPAKKISIYSFKKFIDIKEKEKINLKTYEMQIHKLLANCLTFILFAIIAAIICFPINRYKSKTNVAIKVIIAIIAMRFLNNLLETFAYGNILPVWQASWGVVLILLCLSTAILIWQEI